MKQLVFLSSFEGKRVHADVSLPIQTFRPVHISVSLIFEGFFQILNMLVESCGMTYEDALRMFARLVRCSLDVEIILVLAFSLVSFVSLCSKYASQKGDVQNCL